MKNKLVHILKHGYAMCGRPGIPSTWEPKEYFLSFEDPAAKRVANCQACLRHLQAHEDSTITTRKH